MDLTQTLAPIAMPAYVIANHMLNETHAVHDKREVEHLIFNSAHPCTLMVANRQVVVMARPVAEVREVRKWGM